MSNFIIKMSVLTMLSLPMLVSSPCFSQEVDFDRFEALPLNYNPALTGDFDGSWRAAVMYKNQWTSEFPFKSYAFSFDMPYYMKNEKFSFGIVAVHDDAYDAFSIDKVLLSLAYNKNLNYHYISGGVQAGYINYSMGLKDLIWPGQYDQSVGDYDQTWPTGELLDANAGNVDINIGLNWRKKYVNHYPSAGVAVNHINYPNISLSENKVHLNPKIILHAKDDWSFNSNFYISPGIFFRVNSGTRDIQIGSLATYVLNNGYLEKSIFAGIHTRSNINNYNTAVFMAGVNFNQWSVGLSFNMNTTKAQREALLKKGFEISIVYKELSNKLPEFTLPCSRF